MTTRKFIVELDERSVHMADVAHWNGVTFAKFIRDELRTVGGNFCLDDPEFHLYNGVKVTPVNLESIYKLIKEEK